MCNTWPWLRHSGCNRGWVDPHHCVPLRKKGVDRRIQIGTHNWKTWTLMLEFSLQGQWEGKIWASTCVSSLLQSFARSCWLLVAMTPTISSSLALKHTAPRLESGRRSLVVLCPGQCLETEWWLSITESSFLVWRLFKLSQYCYCIFKVAKRKI